MLPQSGRMTEALWCPAQAPFSQLLRNMRRVSSFLHKFCRSGYRRQLYLANDTQNLIPDTCFHHCWHTMGTLSIQTQPSLRDALKAAVAPIENVPEVRRNWYSTSHDTVLDLVHPSLVPVIYGRTVLQDSVVG